MDFPTPTPFPQATPPFDIGVPDGSAQKIVTDVVQWWQIGQQHNVTTMIQLILLILIIVGGIVAISIALRGFNE